MNRVSDLERQYVIEALNGEFRSSASDLFRHRLEASFCQHFGTKHAVAVNSGTSALHVALISCGVAAGDEVVVPPLTMASTSMCALQCGAVPVFADVDRETFTLEPGSVSACITDRTKAIIPVSLYGLPPDYDGLTSVCRHSDLSMIEDNAQCYLGRYHGHVVGSFGDISCYSFQASKHMTCGDGGILTTDCEEHADRARQFATLGYSGVSTRQGKIEKGDVQDPAFPRHVDLGYNYRLSELNAAVALAQLERLDQLVEHRVKVATMYQNATQEFNFLIPQRVPDGLYHCYWSYPLLLDTDKPEVDWYEFRDLFRQNGGESYYAAWLLTYREPLMQNYKASCSAVSQSYEPGLCPNAEYLQPRLIQLQTNHWDLDWAAAQAEILHLTAKEFSR